VSRYDQLAGMLHSAPRTWLVTGVAGFIGSHLLETLLRLDQTVVGLDNFATGSFKNVELVRSNVSAVQAGRFSFLEGDIRDPGACHKAVEHVDIVLHQAALASVPRSIADPVSTHSVNVDGFLNVLLAAHGAKVERIVYASSSSVYGDDLSDFKVEQTIGHPLSAYAATKRIDEIYADAFGRTHGIDTVGLRYFNVFGPRQDPAGPYAAVIPRWSDKLFSGDTCLVHGDGSNSRDFCFVENVVQANLLAATASLSTESSRVFNVGCGARTTLLELFSALRNEVARYRPQAASAQLQPTAPRQGDIAHSLASIALARAELGYEPACDVASGLRETIAHDGRRLARLETRRSATDPAEECFA
jgi:UDP-N-acetylglucosamine/UDP-N-acetyl-alpha-D-glucosaminouronate 4-epimerase